MGLCKDYWFVVTMCTLMIPLPCKSRTRAFEYLWYVCCNQWTKWHLWVVITHLCWLHQKFMCLSPYHFYDACTGSKGAIKMYALYLWCRRLHGLRSDCSDCFESWLHCKLFKKADGECLFVFVSHTNGNPLSTVELDTWLDANVIIN